MSKHQYFKPTAIVIALAAVFPAATAWADEVEELTNPNVVEATVRLQYQDEVNPLYRQYNGVNKQGGNGAADLDVVQREETTWFKLNARNLGLRTQEIETSYEKQGDWAVGLSYDQIPRFSPYVVGTAVTGVGSGTITQPSYAAGEFASGKWIVDPALKEVTLKTGRDITTLTASKYLSQAFKLGFSFKNEDKTGTRMSGVRGVGYSTSGTSANKVNYYGGMLFAPEPIDQNHKQIELTADYMTSKYQVTAGYYGSFLNTRRDALSVIGGTNTQLIGATTTVASTLSPIALAPDNSAQQLYVNGAYNFSADTRANFKVAYSEGRQSDSFLSGQPMNVGIGGDLGGLIETTEVFGSLTSRITRDLKVLASWRYEDRQDKTRIRTFYRDYPNNPETHTSNKGKLEADYRLGAGYGLTAGLDYSDKSSPQWANGVYPDTLADKPVNTRKELDEKTYRLALRKSMSETVNGMLSLAHSERDGSDWVNETPIYPVYMSDRNRDKVRAMVDWAPAASVNLQFAYEAYFDQYLKSENGLDSGDGQVFSLDGSYAINDDWKLNAWYSKQTGVTDQTSFGQACIESLCTTRATTAQKFSWDAKLKLDSDQFGLGLKGKVRKVEVGAEYLYAQDRNEQELNLSKLPAGLTLWDNQGVLPDTKYVQNTFKLFASYPLDKATTVRADYIYDLRKMDDYTWENWVYGDGTRVFVDPKQTTQIFGVSLSHKF